MTSWRKLVLDVIEGRVAEPGESVREAIDRCRCEPQAAESGSFAEAVDKVGKDTKKIKQKISDLRFNIARLHSWINSTRREWGYPPNNLSSAVERGFDILDDIEMNEKYTAGMLERLQSAFDKADALISPLMEEKKKKYDRTPCGKIFQELIFGWKKEKGHYKEYETNTEKEDDIQDKVKTYIGRNVADARIVNAMKQLKSCVKEYPDALRPTVTHVWRGIVVTASKAIRFLPMASLLKSNNLMQIGKHTYIGVRGVHKVNMEIESWAAEPKVADHFADHYSNWQPNDSTFAYLIKSAKMIKAGKSTQNPQEIARWFISIREDIMDMTLSIVYEIKVDEDFIFAEWFANALSRSQDIGKESEVTRISELGTEKPATVFVRTDFIYAIKQYNEKVQELRGIMGEKMPKTIKEITFG